MAAAAWSQGERDIGGKPMPMPKPKPNVIANAQSDAAPIAKPQQAGRGQRDDRRGRRPSRRSAADFSHAGKRRASNAAIFARPLPRDAAVRRSGLGAEEPRNQRDHGQKRRQGGQLRDIDEKPESPLKPRSPHHRNAPSERYMFIICSLYVSVNRGWGICQRMREPHFWHPLLGKRWNGIWFELICERADGSGEKASWHWAEADVRRKALFYTF
jgi:hypothetical protein